MTTNQPILFSVLSLSNNAISSIRKFDYCMWPAVYHGIPRPDTTGDQQHANPIMSTFSPRCYIVHALLAAGVISF